MVNEKEDIAQRERDDQLNSEIFATVLKTTEVEKIPVKHDDYERSLISLRDGGDFNIVIKLLVQILTSFDDSHEQTLVRMLQQEVYTTGKGFVARNPKFVENIIRSLSVPK